MMSLLLGLSLIFAVCRRLEADSPVPPGVGLGLYSGVGPGGLGFYALSAKKGFGPRQAVEGAVGGYFREFYAHVDYKWYPGWSLFHHKNLPLYIGPGLSTFVGHDGTWVGLRGTIGTSRLFPRKKPLELFVEFTPSFFVTPERIWEAALGFGGRIYF